MQILPAVDLRGGKCVRLRQGDYNQETVFSNDPVEMAQRWADDGIEWLHLVDLDGAKEGQPVNHHIVKAITSAVGISCELGGGIRDESSIRLMLEDVGVGRVIIGTQALKDPAWFQKMAGLFPGKLVLGIDARDSMVATEGWLDVSKTSAIELAKQYSDLELAALIYTNIANDGMMQGVDEATIDDVHRLKVANESTPTLDGIIIGRALYEGTIDVAEAVAAVK